MTILFAVTACLYWPVGVSGALPGNLGDVPAYEKKVNWNVAVLLVDYQDIPSQYRSQWPTALDWERLIFHGKFQEYVKTISNGEFVVTGDVFDYTTSTAKFWDEDRDPVLLSSVEVVDSVDFQVPGFDPDRYDLLIINSGHDAALGGGRTNHYNVTVNGSKISHLAIVLFFQIGHYNRSTSDTFYNTLTRKNQYSIPMDDGTSEEGDVVYDMSEFMSTLSHEFGHALGIGAHANSRTNGERFDYEPEVPNNADFLHLEYGNAYDIMGNEEYAISFNGHFRNIAGLLPQGDIVTFEKPGTFTTTLRPINSTQSHRYLEILLPFEEAPGSYKNRGYGLEVRDINWLDTMLQHEALDGNLEGLFVYKNDGISNLLLDMSPSANISMSWGEVVRDIRDVVLKPGMVYENDEVKLYDVVDNGDGSFSVTVDIKSDKAWTDTPENLTATTVDHTGQIRLDWKNNHVGSGSTGDIQVLIRTLGTDGWQVSPFYTAANDATSFVFPFAPDPGESWEYAVYVKEDATHFRSLNSNVVSNVCNLKFESLVETNISCAGETDGQVEIVVSGGTPPYEYGISGQAMSPSNVLGNLGPGAHSVAVRDANKCEASATTAVIVEPRPIRVAADVSPSAVEISANFGTGLYEYSLDGNTWGTDPHLVPSAGQTTAYVRDQRGCTGTYNLDLLFADGFERVN